MGLNVYYSGGTELNEIQKSPLKSLGGYRSGVIIPNGKVNSLFDNIGSLELEEGYKQVICIFIKTDEDIAGTKLVITGINTNLEKLSIGASVPATTDGPVQVLDVFDEEPYNVDFNEVVNSEEISLGDILENHTIALWIIRELLVKSCYNYQCNLNFDFSWT